MTIESDPVQDAILDAIDGAERIVDPIESLVERTATDLGAPFAPEVVTRLRQLRQEDRPAFEALRAQLKRTGVRVRELDRRLAAGCGDEGQPSQAELLIRIAGEAELFHSADGTAYADIDVAGHRETWPVRSKGFRRSLSRRLYQETGGAAGSEAFQAALNVRDAKAHYDGPERTVFVRVGGEEDRLYLDLVDEAWRAVEIDSQGWRIVDQPPVRFRRSAGMQPILAPVSGGSMDVLRTFLNVGSDAEFVLVVAWILAVLRDRGPYPILALSGEQGSAKSTFSAILRKLADPNKAPLRALPREDRDLFIAAGNAHILAFDNVSGTPALDLRHAVPARDRRRLRHPPAPHRSGRGAVRRRPAGDPEWDRGHGYSP
jgi:hypothetical protein